MIFIKYCISSVLILLMVPLVPGERARAHNVDLDDISSSGRTTRDLFLEGTKRFQKSKVNAKATFTAPGLDSQATFVTNIVNFTSTDANVASIDGNTITGVSPGNVRVNIDTSGTNTVILDDTVSVTPGAVKVTSISVSALTNSTISGTVVDNATNTVTPMFETQQVLEKEGDMAGISVTANMEDGTFMDITNEATLSVTHPGLGLSHDADGPNVVVVNNAAGFDGDFLVANWSVFGESGVQESISGKGRIMVTAPTPTSMPTGIPTVYVPDLPTSVPTPTIALTGSPSGLSTYIPYPTSSPSVSTSPTSAPSSNSTIPTSQPTVYNSGSSTVGSSVNTSIPTLLPTYQPTPYMPTSVPTAFGGVGLEISKLHPDILLTQSGDGPIPHKNNTYVVSVMDLGSSFTRPFEAFFNQKPGDNGGFKIRFAGIDYGSVTYSISKYPPATIQGIVKTDILYFAQNTLGISYQVRDSKGASQVNTNGLIVSMEITNSKTGVTLSANCNSPNSQSGLGSCEYAMSGSSWFSEVEDIPVAIELNANSPLIPGVHYIISPSYSSVLKKKPSYKSLQSTDKGMVGTLPQYPKLPGSRFSVPVTGYSGGENAIVTWVITITYDSAVLAHVNTQTSDLYTAAVESFPDSRTIILSSTGLANGVDPAQVTGSDILMFTLTWQVVGGAVPSEYSDSFSIYVNSFVNYYSITFFKDALAQINGEVDTTALSSSSVLEAAQVTVHNTTENGILAYALDNEVINDARVTGVNISIPIYVVGVENHIDVSDVELSSHSECKLGNFQNDTVMLVQDCKVVLMNSHSDGGSYVPVDVGFSGYTNRLFFHVWQYLSFELTASDYKLNMIY